MAKDNNDVVDEICACDHLKSQHGGRYGEGHGACGVEACECAQFTWMGFVNEKDGARWID